MILIEEERVSVPASWTASRNNSVAVALSFPTSFSVFFFSYFFASFMKWRLWVIMISCAASDKHP